MNRRQITAIIVVIIGLAALVGAYLFVDNFFNGLRW